MSEKRVNRKNDWVTISLHMPEVLLEGLDMLVEAGLYASRSEAMRIAVRDLLKRELKQEFFKIVNDVVSGVNRGGET